jgi:hypothetical protein
LIYVDKKYFPIFQFYVWKAVFDYVKSGDDSNGFAGSSFIASFPREDVDDGAVELMFRFTVTFK